MTHDYKRQGTTALFALDQPRNIYQDKELHLICNNYAIHKHPKVIEWLEKHPRFQVHFTPMSAPWLNMSERFFRSFSTDQLKRGVLSSVPELIIAIKERGCT